MFCSCSWRTRSAREPIRVYCERYASMRSCRSKKSWHSQHGAQCAPNARSPCSALSFFSAVTSYSCAHPPSGAGIGKNERATGGVISKQSFAAINALPSSVCSPFSLVIGVSCAEQLLNFPAPAAGRALNSRRDAVVPPAVTSRVAPSSML